jgi:hypothetical protein
MSQPHRSRGQRGYESSPAPHIYSMAFPTFKQYVDMRERVLLPDQAPAKGLSRITPSR